MSNKITVSLSEATDLIARVGHKVTFLVSGHTGFGKSSMIKTLSKQFPGHFPCYFDCTTKVDSGDLAVPEFQTLNGTRVVSFAPNAELGLHAGMPVLLMIDEIGKNKAILNALLRLMLERVFCGIPLPEGSIVFATTNLGAEGLGDMLPPHVMNRLCEIELRKVTGEEWRNNWAIHNGVHPVIMAASEEYPGFFASFTDRNIESNHYVYDPKRPRRSFVTLRSLEKASDILWHTEGLPFDVKTAALMGVVGEAAAMDIMTIARLDDSLPTTAMIVHDPENVRLPSGGAEQIILSTRLAYDVTEASTDNIMTYIRRLPREIQVFCARMMLHGPNAQLVSRNRSFCVWTTEIQHLLA